MPAFLLILNADLRSVKTAPTAARASAILWMLAIAMAAASAIRSVDLMWRRMERSETGRARWIWATDDVKSPHPLKFAATRSILIDAPVEAARARIFVDRSYRFFVDGVLIGSGGQKPGDALDSYDLSSRLRPGRNDLVIEAASPTGIGGILFGLDISGHGRNAVVSDASWRVDGRPAFVWGEPPIYPWEFPVRASAERASRAATQ